MLLTMSSDTLADLDAGLEQMAAQTQKDGRKHDFKLVFDGMSAGLTVHCSLDPTPDAAQALKRHCECRKYMQRAEGWFGLLIRMSDGMPKVGMELRFPWKHDDALEAETKALAANASHSPTRRHLAPFAARKVGWNDLCPCGSGRKYKKCCLP